jgi:hypothetical protein
MARAATAFSPGKPIAQLTMSGHVQMRTESGLVDGTAQMTAGADGSSRIELDLPSTSRVETRSANGDAPTCQWSGTDGVLHDIALHNCLFPIVWFAPSLSLQPTLQSPKVGSVFVGPASSRGRAVNALQQRLIVAPGRTSLATTKFISNLSNSTVVLDATMYLPVALTFAMHPDDDSSVTIPVEIRYSNYQTLGGVTLPSHIERYLNGTLQMSIDIDNVTAN